MKSRAFTLIELLVVVLIIGILSAIALPQYQKAVTKARFAELKIMVKRVYDAQKVYYLANGKYSNRREELAVTLGPVTANTANYMIPFAHGYCGLEGSVNNEYPSAQNVYCSLNNPQVLLMFRLNTPTKICCNYEVNNHMLDQLCKDETQATSLYGDSTKRHCYAS